MGFFDQQFPGMSPPGAGMGGGGGLGGSPSAFTSPGMNPQILALLMAMGRGQQGQMPGGPSMGGPMMGGGPQLGAMGSLGGLGGMARPAMAPGMVPGMTPGSGLMPGGGGAMPPGATAGGPATVGTGMQSNPILQQLLANPQLLRQLLGGGGLR